MCSAAASSAAKVVVVGGSGFVGSALCKAAVARGADVFSVSRGGKPGAKQLADSSWAREVTWLKGDALNVSPSTSHLTSPHDSLSSADAEILSCDTVFCSLSPPSTTRPRTGPRSTWTEWRG